MNEQVKYSPFRAFIKKFLKQKVAVVAFIVVLVIVVLGFTAPYFVPYDPTVPVTEQYAEKGYEIENLTSSSVPYTLIFSDGSRSNDTFEYIDFESANRRVAAGRGAVDAVNVTAVNRGETYVVGRSDYATSLLRVVVTEARLDEPTIVRLVAEQPKGYLAVEERFPISFSALLSDGSILNDQEEIEALFAKMQSAGDVMSSVRDDQENLVTEEISWISLTPQIISVASGEIIAKATGVGLVEIAVGDLVTVVQVPVETENFDPIVVGFDFEETEVALMDIYKHQPPSKMHWMGTDHQNRDIFSRIMMGITQTLAIGFMSVAIGSIIGTVLGLIAGYFGGKIDTLLSRMVDVLLAFPGMLLSIAIIAILGPGMTNIIFAVATFTVPIFLRIVRASTLSIKSLTYVEAAKSIGVKNHTIIFRHVFPGTISVITVYLTMRIGTAILIGATLSYLGLGGDITAPEWGAMLNAAKDNSRNVFHPTLFPGLAIMTTVLAFNLLGDGLRDALDPKLKE